MSSTVPEQTAEVRPAALPEPRGPLSEQLLGRLTGAPAPFRLGPVQAGDPLADDDLQLALYVCYEQHYRSFEPVDPRWEWEPSLIAARGELEAEFERALRESVPADPTPAEMVERRLRELAAEESGPSLSRYIERRADLGEFREFVAHRSAYQLKEADPHSWAVPRLEGRAKEALIEVQADEYGGGRPGRMHSTLFAHTMAAIGLDSTYGAYLDHVPGMTLATVNLMSLFGLHRRLRGAIVGHLAMFEMTSPVPNRRYAAGLRRLGFEGDAVEFYDEHVEADAVHDAIAAHDLAQGLAVAERALASDVLFGAAALLHLEERFARSLLDAWSERRSSLRLPLPVA